MKKYIKIVFSLCVLFIIHLVTIKYTFVNAEDHTH